MMNTLNTLRAATIMACVFFGVTAKVVNTKEHVDGSAAQDSIINDPPSVIIRSLQTVSTNANTANDKTITLRGGVLLAPPFAIADASAPNGYTGFQGDLLESLQIFASQDGYSLNFELSLSPPQYGPALNLVANDCNTTSNPNSLEDCSKFDLIIGDYYCNAERSVRVDFSPSWLRTTMSTIKTINDNEDIEAMSKDFTTLSHLQEANGTVCVPEGTYLSQVVMEKFPKANYNSCPSPDECVSRLKSRICSLYVDDELALRHRALNDPSLEVTGEQFNTQYIVWPISYNLDQTISKLLKKWMYASVSNATLDELSYKYFTVKMCPLGRAGENCDKNCDPKHGVSDRYGRCICHSIKWKGDDCSIEVKEDLNLYPTWMVIMCYVLFSINALACLGFAAWIHENRNLTQIKLAQPFFLHLVLLGCLISSASIIPSAQQSSGDDPVPACTVFPWLFCIGFSVTFSTLFAKIRRVYILIGAASEVRKITVSVKETFNIICAITIVDVIICSVWTGVDAMVWVREVTVADQFGEPLSSVGYCTSDHWKIYVSIIGVWHLLLMVLACTIIYLSWNISTKFSESKYLAVAMVSNLQIYIVSVPVLILIGADPKTTLFIRASVIWISNFAIIAIIFGSLMYSVFRYKEEGISLGRALRIYERRVFRETLSRFSH